MTRRSKFLLRGVFSAALIGFVLRKVDWGALGGLLARLHPGWALAGWALTLPVIGSLALRLQIFLRQQSITLPFTTVLSLTWGGQFFNSVLPGSTGGDVVKIYQLCRLAPDRKAAAAATVLVDRLAGLLALVLLAGLAFVIEPAPLQSLWTSFSITNKIPWLLSALVMSLAMACLIVFRLRSTLWGGRLIRTVSAAQQNLSFDRKVMGAFGLALAMHVVNSAVAYCFARALGTSLTFLQVLIMVPVVALFVMLPVTINGHGLREWLLIGYFSQLGVMIVDHPESGVTEIAVALSLLLVANDLLWSIPGGLWYFARFKSYPDPANASDNSAAIDQP